MTHQSSALKILAIGSPLSQFALLSTKVSAINSKHGPFDACVLVGDVFKPDSDGSELVELQLPVPTYFTVGGWELPQLVKDKIHESGGPVAANLVFLAKGSVLTTAQGLKIGCAGGRYDEATHGKEETDALAPVLSTASISTLLSHPLLLPAAKPDPAPSTLASARGAPPLPSHAHGLDLLLSYSPPPSLSQFSPSFGTGSYHAALTNPAGPLGEVLKRGKPRYYFWGEGEGFWEREPIGWSGEASTREERWTRSVKLGALGEEGGKKARWFYAFTLPPQVPETPIPARPANTTPNPFTFVAPPLSSAKEDDGESEIGRPSAIGLGKRRATDEGDSSLIGEDGKRAKSEHGPPPENYTCRICNVPGHWIQECPQKPERDPNAKKPRPGYVCKICQSPDHLIRDCPVKASGAPRPPPPGYVCRACGLEGAHMIRDCPVVADREQQKAKRSEMGPAECWFCLSNPKVTKHLIVAIGSETYVTLPKGQLIPTTPAHVAQGGSKPLVPGGGHVLIIPIAHHPTLLSIPVEDAMPIISEIESSKSALRACYASYGAVPVTFEVARLSGRGGHAHIQVVPIPKDLGPKVADSFRIAGERQGLDWEADPERALARSGSTGNYFKVECPDGTKLVHLLKGNFDLQFGRMVLGSLMGLQHRIDWKECGMGEQEEKEDAVKFKKAFAAFNK